MSHGMKKFAHTGPNMTPMVDVVMCILIFFMLGSSFAATDLYLTSHTPVCDAGVGPAVQEGFIPTPAVRSYIQLVRYDQRTVASAFGLPPTADLISHAALPDAIASLPDILRRQHGKLTPDAQIVIAADRRVPYQDVISAYDACTYAGFAHVAFALPR